MSSYPIPRDDTNVTKQLLTLDKKQVVFSTYETKDTITYYIGGYDLFCLELFIMKQDSLFSRILDVSVAKLNKIQYNKKCSLHNNFERGIDTSVILKFMISYVSEHYPYITSISFNDASSRECDNGHEVNLAAMSYLISGKTWYEKHYGAYLEPKSKVEFEKYEKEFQKKKMEISWELMKSIITTPLPMNEYEMEVYYTNALTWQEFFKAVSDSIGISDFCKFIAPWLNTFLKLFFKVDIQYLTYRFPIKNYAITYTLSNYQRGGRIYTRKHKRNHLKNVME